MNISFYKDVARALSADICIDLDSVARAYADAVICEGVARSGLSFLTVDLPLLGKSVDKSLANGLRYEAPNGWALQENSVLPAFHYPRFRFVFEDDGTIRHDADPWSVSSLRQLCFSFYKLRLPFTKEQTAKAVSTYLLIEDELPKPFDGGEEVLTLANRVVRRVLAGFDPSVIQPRHGPGSVSTGEKLWEKMNFKRFIPQLDAVYPYADHMFFNYSHLCDELERLGNMTICEDPTNKIVFVPKDSRGPRTISSEPLELQWIQQGLSRKLVTFLESPRSLIRGFVNFSDQSINRRLALSSSVDRKWATLDMKEASDRVSLRLVQRLFDGTAILPYLLATRSTSARLPDGQSRRLEKFAPMGSALCFPVEALVFYALAVATINLATRKPVKAAMREVYVFGDDIIVETGHAALLMETYPKFHLMVNQDKSCVGGFFRESCGCDAFLGIDVTPTRFSRNLSTTTGSPEYLSWIDYSNQLYSKQYFTAAILIEQYLLRHWVIWTTAEAFTCPTFIRPTVTRPYCRGPRLERMRWNKQLHRTEIYSTAPVSLKDEGGVSGWSEMLRTAQHTVSSDPAAPYARMTLKAIAALYKQGDVKPEWMSEPWEVNEVRLKAFQYTLPKRVKLQRGWHPKV